MAAMLAATPPRSPELGLDRHVFTIDGRPAWLAGVSLFDALGRTPPADEDLDIIRQSGIRLVRVWAHWHLSVYDAKGRLTADGRVRLRRLVSRLRSRGLLLELVLLRPGELNGQPFATFDSPATRLTAVRNVTEALAGDRDVLFDLFNEHDHPDGPISHADLRAIRDAVKAIDPKRIVTVSSTESHLLEPDGRVTSEEAANLVAEAGMGAGQVGVDIIAPHFPRTPDFADRTAAGVRALRDVLERAGFDQPIYLNEPKRTSDEVPMAADVYRRAAAGARSGGAAGWVFHTAAGFDLRASPFGRALTVDERRGLNAVGGVASAPAR